MCVHVFMFDVYGVSNVCVICDVGDVCHVIACLSVYVYMCI